MLARQRALFSLQPPPEGVVFCGENYRPELQRRSMVRHHSWRLAGGRQAGDQQIFILSHCVFSTFKIARETSQKDIISAWAKLVPEAMP